MSAEIVKLPYDISRRLHSRKPRRSKNGTPEERAAKAAATQQPGASVIALSNRADKPGKQPDDSFSGFLVSFRTYFEAAFARGLTVDQIFDELEATHRTAEEAKKRFLARRDQSETSDFPLNLPVPDLGQSVLNLVPGRDQ
jgi:hypothetical protein